MSSFRLSVNNKITRDTLCEMQLQIYDIFKSQNPELLDVIFEIDGKKLYADKLRLSAVSSTFRSMLSDRWTSKNEPIKIKDYKFEDFEQFLVYIYSGECSLTDENIFIMLDIAEFYQVNQFKKLCDIFLSQKEYNFENIFQFLEISFKYSNMVKMKNSMHYFISKNFLNFVKREEFLKANKFAVEGFLILQPFSKQEVVFQAVYEWTENQFISKQEESSAENLNKNDAIDAEMSGFLQYFDFKKMDLNFFVQYVEKLSSLFSSVELSDIRECIKSNVKVKVTNSNGTSICGILRGDSDAIEIIKSLKYTESLPLKRHCRNGCDTIQWKTECKIPSTPAQLNKRDFVSWYLIYLPDGDIAVTPNWKVSENDYLIAEMVETDERYFLGFTSCKIDIVYTGGRVGGSRRIILRRIAHRSSKILRIAHKKWKKAKKKKKRKGKGKGKKGEKKRRR